MKGLRNSRTSLQETASFLSVLCVLPINLQRMTVALNNMWLKPGCLFHSFQLDCVACIDQKPLMQKAFTEPLSHTYV